MFTRSVNGSLRKNKEAEREREGKRERGKERERGEGGSRMSPDSSCFEEGSLVIVDGCLCKYPFSNTRDEIARRAIIRLDIATHENHQEENHERCRDVALKRRTRRSEDAARN